MDGRITNLKEIYECPKCKREYINPSYSFCLKCFPVPKLIRKEVKNEIKS